MAGWGLGSTLGGRTFSAALTARLATCSRSFCLADCTSWSICALADKTRRSPSVLACDFDSSMRRVADFSAAATISWARARASRRSPSVCFCASASEERPRSASARPSAMSFCRSSIFLRTIGQTHLTETMMNRKNVTAWANNVTLRFIGLALPGSRALLVLVEQRVDEREQPRQAHAVHVRRTDQPTSPHPLAL